MNTEKDKLLSKVPEVTLIFWIIKILATTLGETGGDAVTMSMNLGYLVGTGIFSVIFIVAVVAQISAKKFHPLLIGPPSSPRPRWEPRWPISPIVPWASAMRADRRSCSFF